MVMRRNLLLVLLAVLAAVLTGAQPRQASRGDECYGVGVTIGEETRSGLGRDGVGLDPDLLSAGFSDGLAGADPTFSPAEMEGLLVAVHREMEDRMERRLLQDSPEFRAAYDRNLRRSRAFHDAFGREEGVVTLPSGAQYKVLVDGPPGGRSPRPGSTVVVDAMIQVLDLTFVLQSERAAARLDDLVPGAIEILQLMKEGDRWQVALPPELAFGGSGRSPDIGPNEALVGIVELREVRR